MVLESNKELQACALWCFLGSYSVLWPVRFLTDFHPGICLGTIRQVLILSMHYEAIK